MAYRVLRAIARVALIALLLALVHDATTTHALRVESRANPTTSSTSLAPISSLTGTLTAAQAIGVLAAKASSSGAIAEEDGGFPEPAGFHSLAGAAAGAGGGDGAVGGSSALDATPSKETLEDLRLTLEEATWTEEAEVTEVDGVLPNEEDTDERWSLTPLRRREGRVFGQTTVINRTTHRHDQDTEIRLHLNVTELMQSIATKSVTLVPSLNRVPAPAVKDSAIDAARLEEEKSLSMLWCGMRTTSGRMVTMLWTRPVPPRPSASDGSSAPPPPRNSSALCAELDRVYKTGVDLEAQRAAAAASGQVTPPSPELTIGAPVAAPGSSAAVARALAKEPLRTFNFTAYAPFWAFRAPGRLRELSLAKANERGPDGALTGVASTEVVAVCVREASGVDSAATPRFDLVYNSTSCAEANAWEQRDVFYAYASYSPGTTPYCVKSTLSKFAPPRLYIEHGATSCDSQFWKTVKTLWLFAEEPGSPATALSMGDVERAAV